MSEFNMFDLIDIKEEKTREDKPVAKENKKNKAEPLDKNEKKYKFPFQIYFAGETRDVSHIFENDVEYSEKEISSAMLEHQYFEFAGEVNYDYKKEDNLLVAMFVQHKKG